MEIVTHVIVRRGVNKPYVEIPEGVTHIGDEVFLNLARNSLIEHVILPSTLIKIGNAAFSGCKKLLSVDFSRCTELEEIGTAAFSGCTNLRHVHLGNCVRLRSLSLSVFRRCDNLVLHVPRNITSYNGDSFIGMRFVALPLLSEPVRTDNILLPLSAKSDVSSLALSRSYTGEFYTDEYDKFSDVFDAIGQLNVLWVESLRRQGRIRMSNIWSKQLIVVESQTRNRVMGLWARVEKFLGSIKRYELFGRVEDEAPATFFFLASDILTNSDALVSMTSYQRQPAETKLFKAILEHFGEEWGAVEPVSGGESKQSRPLKKARRLMANLRL